MGAPDIIMIRIGQLLKQYKEDTVSNKNQLRQTLEESTGKFHKRNTWIHRQSVGIWHTFHGAEGDTYGAYTKT